MYFIIMNFCELFKRFYKNPNSRFVMICIVPPKPKSPIKPVLLYTLYLLYSWCLSHELAKR